MKNFPSNSSLRRGILVPFIYGRELNYAVDNWGNRSLRSTNQAVTNLLD